MPVGDAAGSFLGGLLQGKAQGREQKVKNAYVDAQKTHVKKQSDALQAQIEMEAMKSDILKNMTPEQRQMALYPKSADPSENLKKILDMLGGGTASPPPAPASLPFGGGTQNFPLDPSLTAPSTPTLPDQIAKGQMGGFQIDSIDTGTGAVKLAPTEYQSVRGVRVPGQQGPQTIRVPKSGAGTFPEYQAPDMVTEQLPSGETVEYKVDKETNQPVPGSMRVKTRVAPIDQKTTLADGTEVTQRVNPFTNEPVGGEATFTGRDGKTTRITAPPPVEEFKFTDPKDGIDKSVVRNKQTGVFVTTPIPVAPIKGTLITEAGKIEGATKALNLFGGIKKSLINPDGSLNRSLVFKIWTPGGGIGEGRKFLAQFREGLDVKTRVMSGAAIRPEEEAMYKAIYLPHPLDNDDTARDKLKRFEETMQGLLAIADPSGLGAGRVEKATGGKKKPDLSLGKGKDPSTMSDAELLKALR